MQPNDQTTKSCTSGQPAQGVLIVDTDRASTRIVLETLARENICGTVASDIRTARAICDRAEHDLILINSDLSDGNSVSTEYNGFTLAQEILEAKPEASIVILFEDMTCRILAELTVRAMKSGCVDVLTKPLQVQKLQKLLNRYAAKPQNITYTQTVPKLVGKSPKLLETIEMAKRIATTSMPVLISGESGSGKELFSELIHHSSPRAQGTFIKVNCAALSETLLESELFGHEKGAFTGAACRRIGKFELANGGTLMLDEITETPPAFQAKLLRVLEQQEFERVGGTEKVCVNVRVISTTNRNLKDEVLRGAFRADLYYRLSAVRLVVPPLRDRTHDISDLAWSFVGKYAKETGRVIKSIDPSMLDIFKGYHWPGNIRQLKNVIVTSLILGTGSTLRLADVSWLFDELEPRAELKTGVSSIEDMLGGISLEELETKAIIGTLKVTDGNQTAAAKVLGISDRTLRDKLKKYKESLQPA